MYTEDRNAYRHAFFLAWKKHLRKLPVEPLEAQIIAIICDHPEYHTLLEKPDQHDEYLPEENPFIHMSLHLAIREQMQTNRPQGVNEAYSQLLKQWGDPHKVQHALMQCLAELLWSAQQSGIAPSEDLYLKKIRSLYEQGQTNL